MDWESLLHKTREQVVEIVGQPEATGGTSRKYRTPSIYKYGDIEVWFLPWKIGTCHAVWNNDKHEIICGK